MRPDHVTQSGHRIVEHGVQQRVFGNFGTHVPVYRFCSPNMYRTRAGAPYCGSAMEPMRPVV